MKAFVIAIEDNELSMKAANRCIDTAKTYDIDVQIFKAITPSDNPLKLLEEKGIPVDGFNEKYSRLENCVAAFLSHYSLWEMAAKDNDDYLILEHDAYFVGPIPKIVVYNKLISFGHPSYGKYNTPNMFGVNPLTSKPYLPGAHAYMLNRLGAKAIIEKAKTDARPTDVFLNTSNFPWLEEYYPWAVEARDTFTTIQKEEGCLAKHNWKGGTGYDIV